MQKNEEKKQTADVLNTPGRNNFYCISQESMLFGT